MCRPCLYTAHVYRDDVTFDLGRYYIYAHNQQVRHTSIISLSIIFRLRLHTFKEYFRLIILILYKEFACLKPTYYQQM
jgi:hypothetical protein